MGRSLLEGWIADGLEISDLSVFEPSPSDWLKSLGVRLNRPMQTPAICVFAVKPQVIDDALTLASQLGGGATLMLSVVAGIRIKNFESICGPATPVVRAMPNTPAAVGKGISALIGNNCVTTEQWNMAERLMRSVGEAMRVRNEDLLDAVTAVSGSGPAYIFHFIDALAAAGEGVGLTPAEAARLARSTVIGAGALAAASDESPSELRRQVTSPGGTTEAAMEILMDPDGGLATLMRRTVLAATERAKKLGQQD